MRSITKRFSLVCQVSGLGGLLLGLALCAVALSLVRRGVIAFSTRDVLEWDETYYASIASTALAGRGLYPSVQGYPPMPVMGGIGFAAYLYVAALKMFGPTILGMRLVSFIAAMIGLCGVYVASARWYGSAAGVMAVVCAAASTLFVLTNSVRMDAFTFAFVAWLMALLAIAFDRGPGVRWHLFTGFVAALGLEVHLHTIAAASACGLLYLVDAWRRAAGEKSIRSIARAPLIGFVAGYGCGAAVFLMLNIAPSPETFFRTAGLTRLAMQHDTPVSGESAATEVTASFASPRMILRKEAARYRVLFHSLPRYETLLWIASIFPLLWIRRHPADDRVRLLIAGSILGGAVIVNGTSPLYESHVWPILLLPIAPLCAHGFRNRSRLDWRSPHGALITLVAVIAAIEAARVPAALRKAEELRQQERRDANAPAYVRLVRATVSRSCHVAGDTSWYVPFFMDYPRFTGTRETEVLIGATYYGLSTDFVTYWKAKRPDVVFGPLRFGLGDFIQGAGYVPLGADAWRAPDPLSSGCEIAPRSTSARTEARDAVDEGLTQ